ncbi:hypothetical protein QBC34DRAFT_194712 [Podospora aff. communis PSN243]|uniref:Uncharacterized protein n=1 Tax=Podospora aff. communis PSN243 TaxID=3040156 RepID=A0AAV9H2V1_9PEZI|nr:hypothetical protein QBC34DRAFT_194712 [Podospora aff. communis PSN243]
MCGYECQMRYRSTRRALPRRISRRWMVEGDGKWMLFRRDKTGSRKRRCWNSGMMLGAHDGTQCVRPPHFSLMAETSRQVPNCISAGDFWLGEGPLASKMEATGMGSGGKSNMVRGTYLCRCGRRTRGARFVPMAARKGVRQRARLDTGECLMWCYTPGGKSARGYRRAPDGFRASGQVRLGRAGFEKRRGGRTARDMSPGWAGYD